MDDTSAKALFILGRVSIRPSHGHEIMRTLYASRSDLWVDLSKKHVYYVLRSLERDHLVSVSEEREGNLPARKVYSITDTGRVTLARMMQADSLVRNLPYSEFDVVLGMLAYTDVLSDADKSAVLSKRVAYLAELTEDARRVAAEASARHDAGGIQPIILEKVARVAETERVWLEELATRIETTGWTALRPVAEVV